ncbi:hypothetical protein LBUL87_0381 [Lactobacillus delbrueckii subsp. bulgaricus]|nr:hypothetical protein LDBUL1632_01324 [Lactobacillus delbrueckii subsp. bulgaricus CNCM I-1632]SNR18960.1 hypothetical protein LBUL87_0381 [Lactobacillus delbrueckii subsp. bulgaricus]
MKMTKRQVQSCLFLLPLKKYKRWNLLLAAGGEFAKMDLTLLAND